MNFDDVLVYIHYIQISSNLNSAIIPLKYVRLKNGQTGGLRKWPLIKYLAGK
jgi:hypothetical protein